MPASPSDGLYKRRPAALHFDNLNPHNQQVAAVLTASQALHSLNFFSIPNTAKYLTRLLRYDFYGAFAALRSLTKTAQPKGCCGFVFVAGLALARFLMHPTMEVMAETIGATRPSDLAL